ncbi:M20 family metallo-hydrolase [Frigidibacter sp.]|uniref:M20 family metallo-hydrolase n=1 Tax=Frigidibacter sp. TaxID=2586418 RepID=UPI00273563EF|nr:M20 family metallo-hydrolase [Frigidibacter sp.]MDP3342434.1 M20 family metallo-hydrolase [Frigidibacter sp.]
MNFAADFAALRQIGADAAGGWSRPAFSEADNAAHDWLLEQGRAAGLDARYDAFGNAILRLEGDGRPALLIGSHLDTVRNGGAFDGAIGVLAGLEVLRRLRASGQPGAPVEAISFRDEEGRFGPFTGSRAMLGQHDAAALAKARAADGETLAEAMAGAGFTPANVPRDLSTIAGYLELHIEQGPVLEQAGCPIGIVTAIAGQERLSLRFTGQADHAGTAPMDLRRDAFAGAARFATAFRDLIRAAGDPALRGTIGVVKLSPNQGNVVPGEVTLGLEIRSTEAGTLPDLRGRIIALAEDIAEQEQLGLRSRGIYSESPVPMDAALQAALAASAAALGHSALRLPSGANHDAGIMGRLVPSAMIFVPSVGGRSHCPEEETEPAFIEAAIDVLHHAVMTLRRVRA